MYWGPDEGGGGWEYVEDVTIQWSTFEGLEHDYGPGFPYEASKSALIGTEMGNGAASARFSFHHNYLANTEQRNPRLSADGPYEVVNNLVYNWRFFGTQLANRGSGIRVNLIGNVYEPGPAECCDGTRYAVGIEGDLMQPDGLIYVRDNLGPYRSTGTEPEWAIMGSGYDPSGYWTLPAPASLQRTAPWPEAPIPLTIHPASEVPGRVLAGAGAQPRDVLDQRLVDDYLSGTGTIKTSGEQQPSWWPTLTGDTPYPDADADGMDDTWETRYGFDPADPADGPLDADADGYTNVEEFLNGTRPTSGLPTGVGNPQPITSPPVPVLAPPFPNPTGGRVLVRYYLPAPTRARLLLLDALGRPAARLANGTRAAGWHTAEVDLAGLPAGSYAVVLRAGGRVLAERLSVTR